MNIIIVGMRRCGTTILFDCLYEDKRFDSYYEPFCYGKVNIGGGSNMKNIPIGCLAFVGGISWASQNYAVFTASIVAYAFAIVYMEDVKDDV